MTNMFDQLMSFTDKPKKTVKKNNLNKNKVPPAELELAMLNTYLINHGRKPV